MFAPGVTIEDDLAVLVRLPHVAREPQPRATPGRPEPHRPPAQAASGRADPTGVRPEIPTPQARPAPASRRRPLRAPALTVLAVVVPLLLSACGLLGSTGSGGTATATDPDAGKPSWFWATKGNPTASATAAPYVSPTPGATATATSTSGTASTSSSPTPPWPCKGRLYPGKMDDLGTTVSGGSISTTWQDAGPGYVEQYLLAAESQAVRYGQQAAPTWTRITPSGRCDQLTGTVSGLAAGESYVLWLDAIVRYPNGERKDVMIARSRAVAIP